MAQLAAFGLPNLSTSFSVSPLAAVGPLPAPELLVFFFFFYVFLPSVCL